MISTLTWMALASSPAAQAGARWLQNDDFSDGDEVSFMGGFIAGECWASVYEPGPADYPFTLKYVDMLVGGSTGDPLLIVEFYSLDGSDMTTASLLGEEAFVITGSSSSWNRLTVSELDLGMGPIDAGNVAVAVCHYEHDGPPSIAVDTSRDAGHLSYIWGDFTAGLEGTDWFCPD